MTMASARDFKRKSSLQETRVAAFRRRLSGSLVLPGDDDYHSARRVWNGMIDKAPAIIAYCANPADVVESVAFARETGLPMAVRAGGHNIAGKSLCDDGLVIDLSRMRRVAIDSESRTARAEGGALLADLDVASQAHGLATTTGVNSDTGLVGLTLGGGIGRLGRKHGLSCDNMVSAEVVTADGQILTASEGDNADLFWALRGGGGNFGVVTEVVYRLHPLGPTVLAGSLIYRWRDARAALRLYAEFSAAAPDEISADAALVTLPGGDRAVSISAFHAGPARRSRTRAPAIAERAPAARGPHSCNPLRRAAARGRRDLSARRPLLLEGAVLDGTSPMRQSTCSWTCIQQRRRPARSSCSSRSAERSPARRPGNRRTRTVTRPLTHSLSRYGLIPRRTNPMSPGRRRTYEAMRPFGTSGVYVNNLGDEGEDRVRAAYGANYRRLAALKRKFDPTNLFRANQNVRPAG